MQNSFFHLHINLYAGYYSTSTKSASYKTLQQDINFVLVKTLQSGGHIYEIAEKPPLQHFEGNTTMSVVLTLWELLISVRPSPSSWISQAAMTTHWIHQLPMVGVHIYIMIHPKISGKPSYKICIPSFCCISRNNRKTWSCVMLATMWRWIRKAGYKRT